MEVKAQIKDGEVLCVTVDGQMTKPLANENHCRQVFNLNNKYYIKFDNPNLNDVDEDIRFQSKYEINISKAILEQDKKYFCMPVAYGEIDGLHYTVQEAVKNEAIPSSFDLLELNGVLQKYQLSDIGYCEYAGVRNCVFTSAGWKIYDYALLD